MHFMMKEGAHGTTAAHIMWIISRSVQQTLPELVSSSLLVHHLQSLTVNEKCVDEFNLKSYNNNIKV